jgi:hypothetical protein
MERSNPPPDPEGCLAAGQREARWGSPEERLSRSVLTGTREPQAGAASGLSNSASKSSNASGEVVLLTASETESSVPVRPRRACRGLSAWRARKEAHGTKEARSAPAALTARAKQEGWRNDKECLLALRVTDWLIVAHGKASAPKWAKGPTT